MKNFVSLVIFVSFFAGCGDKKTEDEPSILPAKNFILNQVSMIDTSLFRIVLLTWADSTIDTSYIRREDFARHAAEFMDIPDISEKKFRNKYEKTETFDPDLGLALFSYSPKKSGMEIIRQDISVEPSIVEGENSKVRSIYVERLTENADSSVLKKLFWQMDEYFQVITIVQKQDQPEKIARYKVEWK